MDELDEMNGVLMQVNGNEVVMFSPTVLRIIIGVPWEDSHILSDEERTMVAMKNMGVLKYLGTEGFIDLNSAINVIVLTRKEIR